MIKKMENESEIQYILDNIRPEDKIELVAKYGGNWYINTLNDTKDEETLVLYGFNYDNFNVPIAMGGFQKQEKDIACVWLISSVFINKNKRLLINEILPLIKQAGKKYKIMYNFIYKSNFLAKRWLKTAGFKFDNPHPKGLIIAENFEFFYRITGRE